MTYYQYLTTKEGKEIKNDKGEVIDIQPSMNDVNFQSSYNYHKKPNKE